MITMILPEAKHAGLPSGASLVKLEMRAAPMVIGLWSANIQSGPENDTAIWRRPAIVPARITRGIIAHS